MRKTCNLQPATCNAIQAFTLVELASVLVIIALIIGMTINSGVTIISSAKFTATQQKMAAIDQALMAYRLANDRLPCPSDLTALQGSQYYGTAQTLSASTSGAAGYCQQVQNATTSLYGVRIYASPNNAAVTAVAEGGVPVFDLGLPYDFMYDGWGNRIRYAVDTTMASTGSNTNTFTGTEVGATCGVITVQGDPMPTTSTYTVGSHNYTRSNGGSNFNGAIYALISHGANGHGAFTKNGAIMNAGSLNADEQTNCNCTSTGAQNASGAYIPTYVQEQPYVYDTTNPLKSFDDIVTYKERWQMQAPWDKPGTSCPRVYVVDNGNNRVQITDMNGNYFGQIKPSGACSGSSGAFSNAFGVFTDNANHAWVADYGNNRAVEFSVANSGTASAVAYLGNTNCTVGTATGQFTGPMNGAIDSSGNIWVVEFGNSRVQKFDSSGNFILAIGCGYGSGYTNGCTTANASGYVAGAFQNPYNLTIDSGNNVWVADSANNRIEEFNNSGTWLQTIGGGGINSANCTNATPNACPTGAGNYSFTTPKGIYTDAFSNIWVADSGNSRIEIFSDSGTFVASIPGEGGNYQGGVVDPAGYQWASGNSQSVIKCSCATALSACSSFTCSSFGSGGSGNLQFANPENFSIPPAR